MIMKLKKKFGILWRTFMYYLDQYFVQLVFYLHVVLVYLACLCCAHVNKLPGEDMFQLKNKLKQSYKLNWKLFRKRKHWIRQQTFRKNVVYEDRRDTDRFNFLFYWHQSTSKALLRATRLYQIMICVWL